MKVLNSKYYNIDTPSGNLHIHIDYDDNNVIQEVFLRISPIGTDISNITAMLGVFLSESLKRGLPIEKAIKHLNSSKSHRKVILKEDINIETIEQGIAFCLKEYYNEFIKEK